MPGTSCKIDPETNPDFRQVLCYYRKIYWIDNFLQSLNTPFRRQDKTFSIAKIGLSKFSYKELYALRDFIEARDTDPVFKRKQKEAKKKKKKVRRIKLTKATLAPTRKDNDD
jgi:hypothetical protein